MEDNKNRIPYCYGADVDNLRSDYDMATIKEFDNEERRRYYGIRVGDEVVERFGGRAVTRGEVVAYGFLDNNSVTVKEKDGSLHKCVAEWCEITKKVEEKQ